MPPTNFKTCLVTGASGFVGRNLLTALRRIEGLQILTQNSQDAIEDLGEKILASDVIFHLAGANRPDDESDFQRVNADLTGEIASILQQHHHSAPVIFSSSIQASRDNEYGRSKKMGEERLTSLATDSNHEVSIYRLPNVFGKWSRPNYNTVIATFCHNIARDLPIEVSNDDHELHLVYVDEVVRCFLRHLDPNFTGQLQEEVDQTYRITLGQLADRLKSFRALRTSLKMPDVGDPLTKYLYSTYLSFLPEDEFAYPVDLKTDDRGWLFELAKSESFGQIFVSTTKPGITRGNHYHDTKVEKFCLVKGSGLIRFRDIDSSEILSYPVDDQQIKIVDIPPGYTHSIENVGDGEMVVLFWANEIFTPDRPDTYWDAVIQE